VAGGGRAFSGLGHRVSGAGIQVQVQASG